MTGSLNVVFLRYGEREREGEGGRKEGGGREVLTNRVINSRLERASSYPFTFPLFFPHK